MGGLSHYNDAEIEKIIEDEYSDCAVMSNLDASSLYILLRDLKDLAENKETIWMDMQEFKE